MTEISENEFKKIFTLAAGASSLHTMREEFDRFSTMAFDGDESEGFNRFISSFGNHIEVIEMKISMMICNQKLRLGVITPKEHSHEMRLMVARRPQVAAALAALEKEFDMVPSVSVPANMDGLVDLFKEHCMDLRSMSVPGSKVKEALEDARNRDESGEEYEFKIQDD